MWRIEHKRHIFALLFFLITVFVFVIVGNVHLWSNTFYGTVYKVPYAWIRGLLMLASSSFLLQTTWHKNLK
jgi:hypothetical protein